MLRLAVPSVIEMRDVAHAFFGCLRAMNWPIWLRSSAYLHSIRPGGRLSRLKNSMMPRTSLPNRIGTQRRRLQSAFAASGAA